MVAQRTEIQQGLKPIEQNGEAPVDLTLTQPELTPKKLRSRGPRFNLSVENADVKTVLFALSKKIEQNIIIDPGIRHRVTVNLKNVTLGQVLENVLRPLGLEFDIESDFIRVSRLDRVTRIFHLNYIISRREGAGHLKVARGRGELNGNHRLPGKVDAAAPQGSLSWVGSSEETDLWKEIESGLAQMVSVETRYQRTDEKFQERFAGESFYSINRQSGVILVQDYPEVLLRVAQFLEAVEGSVQRQVFIQAKIIEVSLNEDFKMGIDWSEVVALGGTGEGANDRLSGSGFNVGVGNASLASLIGSLSRQGEVRVLSSPKLATLNNQRAVMKAGREDIYFIAETQGDKIAFVPATIAEGIVLDVVPQINANGTIMMSIHTSISEKAGERTSPDGMSSLPILEVRESNNVVLAHNGQTVVIGGLMKSVRQRKPEASLDQFSILGRLFPGDGTQSKRSELVILLTPEIMVGAAIDERLNKEKDRLYEFDLSSRIPMGTSKK